MSCICWASHEAASTFQPQRDGGWRTAAGESNGEEAQEGRTDSSSAPRKKKKAEAQSRYRESCRDRLWHKSIVDKRTDAQRQWEITISSK